jgi:hypothetical protein
MNVAYVESSKLLRKPKIKEYIAQLEMELASDAKLRAREVYQEIALLCTSSVSDYEFDEDGMLKARCGVPAERLGAVASVKRTVRNLGRGRKEVTTELRLWDKIAALRMAAEACGIFREARQIADCGILTGSGFDPDLVLGRKLVNQENARSTPDE